MTNQLAPIVKRKAKSSNWQNHCCLAIYISTLRYPLIFHIITSFRKTNLSASKNRATNFKIKCEITTKRNEHLLLHISTASGPESAFFLNNAHISLLEERYPRDRRLHFLILYSQRVYTFAI